jgi:hypothetical protein
VNRLTVNRYFIFLNVIILYIVDLIRSPKDTIFLFDMQC